MLFRSELGDLAARRGEDRADAEIAAKAQLERELAEARAQVQRLADERSRRGDTERLVVGELVKAAQGDAALADATADLALAFDSGDDAPAADGKQVAETVAALARRKQELTAEAAALARRAEGAEQRLAARPEQSGGAPVERLPASALVRATAEAAAGPSAGIAIQFASAATDGSAEPVVARTPEIVQALGNLVENARQFARRTVAIDTRWSADELTVRIADDGPGFALDVLGELGEPYLTSRRDSGHMGLGVFIAKTLLERTGARLAFANRPQGGAEVAIGWRRADIEAA